MGALGIIWDCIIKGRSRIESYDDIIEHIKIGYHKLLENPMRTKAAKKFWDEKRDFVKAFIDTAEYELEEGMK